MTNDANNCVALSELSSSVVSQEYKTGEWVKWLQISTHAQTLTQSCRGDQSVIKEISNQSRAADVPIATRDTCSSYSSMHTVYLCIHPRAVDRYGHIFLCVCVIWSLHYTLDLLFLLCTLQNVRWAFSQWSSPVTAGKVNGTCRAWELYISHVAVAASWWWPGWELIIFIPVGEYKVDVSQLAFETFSKDQKIIIQLIGWIGWISRFDLIKEPLIGGASTCSPARQSKSDSVISICMCVNLCDGRE